MYTTLVIFHVISMVLSMALMSGALALGFLGKDIAARTASFGMVVTAFGTVSGAVLLFFAPVLSECLTLTAYLAGVTALYIYGFGSGYADNARFIRHSASIQKR